MNVYVIIAVIFSILGAIGTAYFKGEKSCANAALVKSLQARIKNQEIALLYYKSAKAKNDQIAQQSLKSEKENLDEAGKINVDGNSCIDDEFLRSLERIR